MPDAFNPLAIQTLLQQSSHCELHMNIKNEITDIIKPMIERTINNV